MLGKLKNRFASRSAARSEATNESEIAKPRPERHEAARCAERSRIAVDGCVAAAVRWARAGGPAWRFGRHSVYRLPWYLVIGEAGAGKSTMLRAAGFRQGRREVEPGDASPRGWCGDDAVLFEATIGGQGDEENGRLLLRRLKRARRRCPINGIIVVIPAGRIMDEDEAARAHASDAIRARIEQAYRACGRRVPVYVLVTHVDRLTGFDAFVGDMREATRERPLGVTFPLRQEARGGGRATRFAQAFDALARVGQSHVIEHLPVRADPKRAAMTCRFPRSLARLTVPLTRFVCGGFDAISERAEPVLLRAVHLSAVLNEGVAACARSSQRGRDGVSANDAMCFGARFLRDIVFDERNLVFSRHALPHRRAVLRSVAAVSTVALAACVGVGLVTQYWRGSAAVAATAPAATALVEAAGRGVDASTPGSMLRLLDAAHGLPCGAAWQDASDGWIARLELVREMHLERACREAYGTVLRETMQPYVVARMTARLKDAHVGTSVQYDTLRAYLMLGDRSHFDRTTILTWVDRQIAEAALSESERAAWIAHARAWADPSAFQSNLPLDAALVAETRARILAQPAAQRLFDSILPKLREARPEPLSVADMAGPGAALVFYRKSAQPLSDGVPGAFTLAGARRYVVLRNAALAQARAESWVLGPAGAVQLRTLAEEVDRLYFARYIAAWDAIIDDVGLRPLSSSGDGVSMVEMLASRESPLRVFLLRAAAETTLATADVAPDRQTLTQAQSMVNRHFEALHRLVHDASPDTSGVAAPEATAASALDRASAQLKEVAVYLKAAALARAGGMLPPPDDALTRLAHNAAGLPAPLGDMLEGLAQEGTSAARTAERTEIEARWDSDAGAFCHAAVDGRYPFAADAAIDVTLDDFTRLFAPGGMLDAFFQANLKAYVDTSTTPWTWRPGIAPPGMSATALRAFERAAQIRESFFSSQSKVVDVGFTLTPHSIDFGVASMTFVLGGQTLSYAGGAPPTAAFKWPLRAAQAEARIEYVLDANDGIDRIEASGPWSLFRLLDRGRLAAQTPDRFAVTYAFGPRETELALAASSVRNPFGATGWRAFHCPSGL